MRPGYKQTELGAMPEDWDAKQIGGLCRLINGRGFKPYEWETVGLPIVRIQNLNGSEDFHFFSGQCDPKILVEHGQLLFAWSGSRGTSFGPHIWNGSTALLNYHTWKVVVDRSMTTQSFMFHALRQLTRYIEDRAHGASALVHTQKWEMEKFPIPIPTSLLEQRAIATALSDVDDLLAKLDQLVAKKRDLKQAAMQQLLTGKTRLPGFSGEWVTQPLGFVVDGLEAGVSVNSIDVDRSAHGYHILKTSAVANGEFLAHECKLIDPADLRRAQVNPRRDTILISRMNTPDLVGEVGYVDRDWSNLFLPDRLWMTRFRHGSDVSVRWLSYLLSSAEYKKRLKSAATGTSGSMKNISKGLLLTLKVRFPSSAEQTAITAVLSDMDAEISALEARCDKTRLLRQGMMQELLTGRIRLV